MNCRDSDGKLVGPSSNEARGLGFIAARDEDRGWDEVAECWRMQLLSVRGNQGISSFAALVGIFDAPVLTCACFRWLDGKDGSKMTLTNPELENIPVGSTPYSCQARSHADCT
jgi:hypothetical protein